ncbi:NUMOD4 domain-containing protein [Flavobacterium sp. GP15]|uniref:NUMOD4 domain-containing protein n=1 Tax=Flavobacterium sp. GP15 TaxID=2758567 RepID=UPI00165E89A5|nr:NUMOD4 domain-containing protein [Flavobacterium sp. GP15]
MINKNNYVNEIWKEVHNFENYEISTCGRLRNSKGRILKPMSSKDHGKSTKTRVVYTISKNGESKKMYAARIMGIAFLGLDPFDKSLVVDHIDNNSMNNCLKNLQLITNRKNCSKDRKNKSGYTGVYQNANGTGFKSYIVVNYEQKYLGTYKTAELANQVYLSAVHEVTLDSRLT